VHAHTLNNIGHNIPLSPPAVIRPDPKFQTTMDYKQGGDIPFPLDVDTLDISREELQKESGF